MSRVGTITFDDFFSYLVVTVEDDLVGLYVNEKPVNEMYLEQLDKIRSVDDPSNIVIAISDCQYKDIVECISPMTKESLAKIDMQVYTEGQMIEKFPDIFE